MSSVPICQHIKTNGELCGCPALKDRRFCYFHDQAERRRRANARRNARQTLPRQYTFQLPLLEDANAVQVAIMETIEALLDGRINHRYAGLIFYALQTASANLKHTTFKTDAPKPAEPWVDEMLTYLRAIPDPNEKPATATPTSSSRPEHAPACVNTSSSRPEHAPACGVERPASPSDSSMTRSQDDTIPAGTIPKIHAAAEPPHSFFRSRSSVFNGVMTRSPEKV